MTTKPEYITATKQAAAADLSKESMSSKNSAPSSQLKSSSCAPELSGTSFSFQTKDITPDRPPPAEGTKTTLILPSDLTQEETDITHIEALDSGASTLKSLNGPHLNTVERAQARRQILKSTSPQASGRKTVGLYSVRDVLTRIISWLSELIRKLDRLLFTSHPLQTAPTRFKKFRLKNGRHLPLEEGQEEDRQESFQEGNPAAEVDKERQKKLDEQAQTPKRE